MVQCDGRDLLIHLAVKYNGDYDKIYTSLVLKEEVPVDDVIKTIKSLKCRVLTCLDYDYPQSLKHLYRPPMVLFYYGDISLINHDQILAVVGSRENSEYGRLCTEKIVSSIARGRVVISGLARGIDAIAHETAIKNGGRTIAVLGSGIDNCYPTENKELYEKIKKHHLIISEYPGKSIPEPHHFPMRNRIVTGLADGIYVPQINSYMSGTMISVGQALELDKPVFVAPDQIGSQTANNCLLDEGAIFTIDGDTILEELHWR